MRRAPGCFLRAAGLIAFLLAGGLIGVMVGLRSLDAWWGSRDHGWEAVPLPDGHRAERFAASEASCIYVRARDGAIFVQKGTATTWAQECDHFSQPGIRYGGCDREDVDLASTWEGRPAGSIAQAMACRYDTSAETGFTMRYLVLDDGEVWRQYVEGGHGLGIVMAMFGMPLLSLVGGALTGALLYGLLLLGIWLARSVKE